MEEGPATVTISEALREAARVLAEGGVAEARREAGSLMAHALGRDRTYVLTHAERAPDAETLTRFRSSVARRAAGEPLQYVTGRQEFYGLDFEVTSDVLIPRPETELLVETALELLLGQESPRVCEVGTGSGCVSVALLRERRDARAVALDISPAALRVAARNAARHGVAERLELIESDCFAALQEGDRTSGAARAEGSSGREGVARRGRQLFHAVVSNPPYVSEEEFDGLQREVREHEPRVALTPGGDGLGVIRRLLADAPRFLAPGGHLLFEIGFKQHEQVAALIDRNVWSLLDIRRDLQGIPRAVLLRRL